MNISISHMPEHITFRQEILSMYQENNNFISEVTFFLIIIYLPYYRFQ